MFFVSSVTHIFASHFFYKTHIRAKKEHLLYILFLCMALIDLVLDSLGVKSYSYNLNHLLSYDDIPLRNLQFTRAFTEESMSTATTSNVSLGSINSCSVILVLTLCGNYCW